jgi:hypothetical protein
LAGADSREDDGPAKIELTYSTLQAINRPRLTIGMPALRIIQVIIFLFEWLGSQKWESRIEVDY